VGGAGWAHKRAWTFRRRLKYLVPARIRALVYSLVAIPTEVSRAFLGLINAYAFLIKYKEILRKLYIANCCHHVLKIQIFIWFVESSSYDRARYKKNYVFTKRLTIQILLGIYCAQLRSLG
jgi:hypothetical protein